MTSSQNSQSQINRLLDSDVVTAVFMVITFWALFADDIRILTCNKDQDIGFYVVTSIVFVIFLIELILMSIAKKGYFLGFFFWLDLVSTLSLLLDIGFISQAIYGDSAKSGPGEVAKAARASRVGTRAARIVRIVRLVRLVKLYKHSKKLMDEKAEKLRQQKNAN